MSKPVFIIINPYCHQGRGWKRWLSIREEVYKRLPDAKEIITEKNISLAAALESMQWREASCCLISAGGDGSMHHLINTIMLLNDINFSNIGFGAIGLGSSNDLLKPFHTRIKNIPTRINTALPAVWHDLGKVTFHAMDNTVKEKYFIVNASFGATAEGNWHFNHPGKLLQKLKQFNTNAAIVYTAITTLMSYRNRPCNISYNNQNRQADISNINILKIPYVSGSFHYRQLIKPNDGQLALNICLGMKKRELMQTLVQLASGKFITNDHKIAAFTKGFQLQSNQPVIFECDGETELSNNIKIEIVPNAVRVLSN